MIEKTDLSPQQETQYKYEKYCRHSERQQSLPAKIRKGDYKYTKYFSQKVVNRHCFTLKCVKFGHKN